MLGTFRDGLMTQCVMSIVHRGGVGTIVHSGVSSDVQIIFAAGMEVPRAIRSVMHIQAASGVVVKGRMGQLDMSVTGWHIGQWTWHGHPGGKGAGISTPTPTARAPIQSHRVRWNQ